MSELEEINLRNDLQKQFIQLTKENAELKASEEMVSVAMSLLRDERDELRAKLEQAEAKCAEMRSMVKELDEECEAQQYQFDILKQDPSCVWTNMLRGTIAIPSHLVEAHDYQQIKAENAALISQLEVAVTRNIEVTRLLSEYAVKVKRLRGELQVIANGHDDPKRIAKQALSETEAK